MRRLSLLAMFCFTFIASDSQAQSINTAETALNRPAGESAITFALGAVDEDVIKQFNKAWKQSWHGTQMNEAVVLILRNTDGSLKAMTLPQTNEPYGFTFAWNPATVAIVHTHPNSCDPKPQTADKEIADRLRVPIFTITSKGMFMYDPTTKQITKIFEGLDWLESSRWSAKLDKANKQELARQ